MTGVYGIIHIASSKIYVGSAAGKRGFEERFTDHKKLLRHGKHHSILLQRAWDKYGEDSFEFIILEWCSPDKAVEREQHWIDMCQSADSTFGYNMCPRAANSLGFTHTEETKEKLSRRRIGTKLSQAHKDAIGLASRGKPGHPCSPDTKAKISASSKGKDMSKATIAAALATRGKPFSREHSLRIGNAVRAAALKRRQDKIGKVLSLRATGLSLLNIGKCVGVSAQTVLNWIRSNRGDHV